MPSEQLLHIYTEAFRVDDRIKIEEVQWLDSLIHNEWTSITEPLQPELVRTVGYVTEETDSYVVLTGTLDTGGQGRHKTSIIKTNIITRRVW